MSTNRFTEFFSFCLDLELFLKIENTYFYTPTETIYFTFLLITQDINKIKNPEHGFVDIFKWEKCT